MSDAWIYGEANGPAGSTARLLAELGFSPHRLTANGSLRPDDAPGRSPAVVVVVAPTGDICERLSQDEELADVPVLVAVEAEHLDLGEGIADGHELLVHPFSAAELHARIARARRALHGVDHGDVVRCGSLEVNLATYQVTIGGKPVDFTFMEYELLKFFATHPGRVFSREALLSRVWGYDYYGGARTVDVHVRRLRAKLGQEHAGRIKTVRSVGYRWEGA
ncbi:winged helix-turn-helix domain-containing protein [Svornostia abyssi]|uniref:Winged helix-turn-helix domain-containing protein n=1 Tax=Svornostia abyssi TaxID=2898438 RepID=A0ABY5PEQ8_9ACTN|nr:winged helix-turn-helix domain-containing protein [Parviterribacteraceae bacterium J379]